MVISNTSFNILCYYFPYWICYVLVDNSGALGNVGSDTAKRSPCNCSKGENYVKKC